MNSNTKKAKLLLSENNYSCVLCKGETVYVSAQRGVRPIVDFIASKTDLSGFSCADKIVGKAAALLYALTGVKEVYAPVMSESACEIFSKHKIVFFCGLTVKSIINRKKTGLCPMELAVMDINDPKEALNAVEQTLKELSQDLNSRP